MRTFTPRRPRLDPLNRFSGSTAFTLIELLVTLAILLTILVALFEFTLAVEQAWRTAAADPFEEADEAFETIVNRVGAATLEPYQDYATSAGVFRTATTTTFVPDHLTRRSDLAFVCGPSSGTNGWLKASGRTGVTDSLFFASPAGYTQTEAHQGLERLMNALGYFVEFGDQSDTPGFILPSPHRWRWRLKETRQPSESLGIYAAGPSLPWVQALVQAGAPISILSENVVALLVLPDGPPGATTTPLPQNFNYDSRDAGNPLTRHQLPARLRLALVAIDEASAQILATQNGTLAPTIVPPTLFGDPSKLDADLATLDANLTANKIRHRLLQREIILPAAAWSGNLSQ